MAGVNVKHWALGQFRARYVPVGFAAKLVMEAIHSSSQQKMVNRRGHVAQWHRDLHTVPRQCSLIGLGALLRGQERWTGRVCWYYCMVVLQSNFLADGVLARRILVPSPSLCFSHIGEKGWTRAASNGQHAGLRIGKPPACLIQKHQALAITNPLRDC